jgi:hypothetical protein
MCRSFLRVSKVTEKIKTRSKPTPSENFNSHPLFAVSLTICKFAKFRESPPKWLVDMYMEKSVFIRRMVHSQSTLQLRRQILKKHLYNAYAIKKNCYTFYIFLLDFVSTYLKKLHCYV